MEESKRELEKEIKQLQEELEKGRFTLEGCTSRLGNLEQSIEFLYHDIYTKNNQI